MYASPCSCPQCQSKPTQTATLNDKNQNRFKKILNAAEIAFKKLHQRQGYKPEDLAEVPEYLQLVQDTASLLSAPIADNVMPAPMAQALKSDAFLFGGLKVHAQLFQVGTMLLHPDGSRKTYNQLRQELDTLNTTYNQHHLQAEYLFATTAAQSAARWAALETDTERYLLQYRTAGDSRVRDSHVALNKVTLPATHAFWDSYYPPNGWRCRCLAIEVRAKDHAATDGTQALADAEKATTQIGKNGKNSLEIFRFNPGKDKRLFPPKHPYNKVKGAVKALDLLSNAPTKTISNQNDLNEYFRNVFEKNKQYFHRGFVEIKPTLKRGVNGFTNMDGTIHLATDRLKLVVEACNNLKNKIKTTYEQEDALSTLHHEVMHNANKVGNMKLTTSQTKYMELSNEWVSRNRLPDFMRELGGELQNKELTTSRKSTGYNRMVKNYDALLKRLECDKEKSLMIVERHLIEESYKNQLDGLLKGLETNEKYTLTKKEKNDVMRKAIMMSNDEFSKMLDDEKLFVKKSL